MRAVVCITELVGLIIVCLFVLFSSVFVACGTSTQCNIDAAARFYRHNSRQSDLILSFTTMPKRLNSPVFKRALVSFFDQTVRPKEIWLNLPHTMKRTGQAYTIPAWLREMPINIRRCEDFGPATKYIPTLQHFQGTSQRILVCDDDNILPRNLVEVFDSLDPQHVWTTSGVVLKETEQGTQPDIWTGQYYRGHSFLNSLATTFLSGLRPPRECTRLETREVHIAMGCHGYVLQASHVDLSCVANLDLLPLEAYYVDDVVMSGCLHRKRTRITTSGLLQEAQQTYEEMRDMLLPSTQLESLSLVANDLHNTRHNDATMWRYFAPWPVLT